MLVHHFRQESTFPPTAGGGDLQHLTRLLRDVIKSLNEAFDKAGTTIVIGGIDISRNIHKGRLHRPFFQLHFWGFAPFDEAQRAKAILGNTFPKSKVTKRPVWVKPKPFDGNIAGYAYGMKANFSQRHTIPKCIDEDGELKRQNTRNGKQMTEAENQTLLTMLAILGLGGRLILQGVTLTENDNGYAKLRLDKGEADGD